MIEEKLDENGSDSSTEQDVSSTPSVEEPQVEEATSEKAVEKEVPFNEHSRFKELISEKNELKEELKTLREKLYEGQRPVQTTKEEDEYAGKTAEEVMFWKTVEKVADKIADKKISEQRKLIDPEVTALKQEYGKLASERFLDKHPDLQRGSEELSEVVNKAREIGGNLEYAYRIVMFEKNAQKEADKVKVVQQNKVKQKVAANVETKSIPLTSMKSQKEVQFKESFNDAWKAAGLE